MRKYSILFCCAGNVCRSPTAEAVFRKKAAAAGVADRMVIDSAGTHGYHAGESPDPRARQAAKTRGYDLSQLRARRFERDDFKRFDLVLAMDNDNRAYLARLCGPSERHKLKLMMQYARDYAVSEVPDPYDGGSDGFETVLDMLEDASDGLLDALLSENSISGEDAKDAGIP